jgi:hypothetical protein
MKKWSGVPPLCIIIYYGVGSSPVIANGFARYHKKNDHLVLAHCEKARIVVLLDQYICPKMSQIDTPLHHRYNSSRLIRGIGVISGGR